MRFNKRLIPVILIMTICTQLFVGCGKEDPVTDTADDQEEYADEEWYDDEKYA